MKNNNILKIGVAFLSLALCLMLLNCNKAKNAGSAIGDAASKTAEATKNAASNAAEATGNAVNNAADAASGAANKVADAATNAAEKTAAAVMPDDGKDAFAEISTDYGTMKVILYKECPQHKNNFIKLANEGFYNDLLFHRIIKGFMIQGGDPKSKGAPAGQRLGSGGPGYKIPAEIGKHHFKGALAAARQGDAVNPKKESSGSQFYIVEGRPQTKAQLERMAQMKKITYSAEDIAMYEKVGGTAQLDNDYTVFGQVIEGMDVIDKIAAVATAPGDRPLKDVKMQVKIVKK